MLISEDPYKIQRQNFSHCMHVLSSPIVFKKLNVFERKYVLNTFKFTGKEVFPTITHEIRLRVHNMYSLHVGFNTDEKRESKLEND